jgi:hypothetical protein
MTDTQADAHVNGTAPAPPEGEQPCDDCASGGEKLMAVLAAAFGALIILMAIDMFTGGKISGMVREAAQ